MKKKTYKALNNKYYNTLKKMITEKRKREQAERRAEEYKEKAEYYKKRFREFGKNVETVDTGAGKCVELVKWEIRPEPWGEYFCLYNELMQMSTEEQHKEIEEILMERIARGLIDNNLVQFIVRPPDIADPLNQYGTVGGKLYVVPWEQMPHRRTLELEQYVEKTLEV